MHRFTGNQPHKHMEEKITTTLLHIIEKEGSIKKLKQFGLTYSEIVDLIDVNVNNGNLHEDNNDVSLTTQGVEFLTTHRHLIKETDKSKWIQPDTKNKMKKIGRYDVFLPSKKELSFLKKLS